jgi:hypothetical protein
LAGASRWLRRTGLLVLGFTAFSLGPALAQYPQDAATAGASDTTVETGQRVILGGEGWEPGSEVALRLPSAELGAFSVDDTGEFSTTVTIPSGVPSGEQFVTVTGTSMGGEPSTIGIRMLVSGSAAAEPEVSFSGGNIALWGLIALAMLLVGIVAVARGRQRLAGR